MIIHEFNASGLYGRNGKHKSSQGVSFKKERNSQFFLKKVRHIRLYSLPYLSRQEFTEKHSGKNL